MIDARYSVIRYVPDPARGEMFNIGILLWSKNDFVLRVHPKATQRACRENPRLAPGSLSNIENILVDRIRRLGGYSRSKLERHLAGMEEFPVVVSKPNYIALDSDDVDGRESAVVAMVNRIVAPKPSQEEADNESQPPPASPIINRLDGFLQREIIRNVVIKNQTVKGMTGRPRPVNYFANSTINAALDVVEVRGPANKKNLDEADLEAQKVSDLMKGERLNQIVVLCSTNDTVIDEYAASVLRAAGAIVETDTARAAEKFRFILGRSRLNPGGG